MQIRLKAKTIATEKKIQDFKEGPSWCLRFMKQKGLSIRKRTTLCQQLPPDHGEKIANFHKFIQTKIVENSIGPDDIINMDEVPLTFDLPFIRTVNKKGEASVTLKTTGHERTHFTCVLGCTASGLKLPPIYQMCLCMILQEAWQHMQTSASLPYLFLDQMKEGWLQRIKKTLQLHSRRNLASLFYG